MVQVKIFKTELKPIGPDENIKKLQNEVNKYIKGIQQLMIQHTKCTNKKKPTMEECN